MTGPATADPEETRRRIITTALRLFGEIGYQRATTRYIAREAGVNEVTLFRHFGSKKNLLDACVENFNAAGFPMQLEQYLTGNYADDILALAHAQMNDMARRLEYVRLLLCDAMEIPELREAALRGSQRNQAIIVDYFRRQIETGVVRPDLDPATLAYAFDSLFSSHLLFQAVFQAGAVDRLREAFLGQLAEIFVRGTMNR